MDEDKVSSISTLHFNLTLIVLVVLFIIGNLKFDSKLKNIEEKILTNIQQCHQSPPTKEINK
jgi:hypothetical protein